MCVEHDVTSQFRSVSGTLSSFHTAKVLGNVIPFSDAVVKNLSCDLNSSTPFSSTVSEITQRQNTLDTTLGNHSM